MTQPLPVPGDPAVLRVAESVFLWERYNLALTCDDAQSSPLLHLLWAMAGERVELARSITRRLQHTRAVIDEMLVALAASGELRVNTLVTCNPDDLAEQLNDLDARITSLVRVVRQMRVKRTAEVEEHEIVS